MKVLRVLSIAALVALPGTVAQVYGQDKEAKPEQHRAEPAKPQAQPKHAQQPKAQAAPKPQRAQQAKPQVAPKQQRAAQEAKPRPQAQPKQQRAEQPKAQAEPKQQRAQQVKPQAEPKQQRAQQAKPQAQPKSERAQHQKPAVASRSAGNVAARQSNYTPPTRTRQQAQTWQKQTSWRQDGAWQGHSSWQQNGSANWQSDHRTWAQRGGYGGYYIPQASFGLHFGSDHWFRIRTQPVIFDGYPRFQYGGFSFLMVDPWPENWAQDWYAADDVYIGYDNGYYLYNRAYPGEAIAVTVML